MTTNSRVKKSMEIYERAGSIIPGVTQLRSRLASGFAEGVSPVYADSATGARFKDVDGHEYIDWVNAVTAIILGHADPIVDKAVKEQIDHGSIYTVNSPKEVELAEELIDTIPSAEMVRYTKGGGDACALAARIARAATGKDIILFSGYHGWHDWYQSANHLPDSDLVTGVGPLGVPKALAGTAIPFGEGDIEKLNQLLTDHSGEIAAIMMEPVRSNPPPKGYLEEVKRLAEANNIILIFDEVSCGWRIAIGGAQEYFGITPDMTVVAKCISNGYPMGAVVGSREAMSPGADAFISSSYWSDNIGLTASIATIRELKRRDSPTQFKKIGETLTVALNEAIDSAGIPARVGGLWSGPTLEFNIPDGPLGTKAKTLFVQEMAKRGFHISMRFNATLSHTEEEINLTAEAAAESFALVREGLEGRMDELLEVAPSREAISRIVR